MIEVRPSWGNCLKIEPDGYIRAPRSLWDPAYFGTLGSPGLVKVVTGGYLLESCGGLDSLDGRIFPTKRALLEAAVAVLSAPDAGSAPRMKDW